MKKHWYFTLIYLCPLCLCERRYKQRRYGRKPTYHKTYKVVEEYDYCEAW